ncbi:NADP-dependent oxidoreductase [Pedobacter psychroterrae]|uniref:NADP-dependent oxidoreductase n=1 Tax=Pedobacter psychroterrae TaxID=2530453 RepID=A0A4R0NKJ9_9SPHI|nr:NADP-dependent oxidoreductase [Pedobacter psychroterrae]TCD01282.1 NADP-dependent oxidoreductase [Pedobacter psychroterrae]
MRAIEITGPIQIEDIQIREIQKPAPAGKEILVRIFAAGINPVDWMAPAYNMFDVLGMPTPYIMGSDFSGIVEAVGPEVTGFKKGDAVFGTLELKKQGSFAEYAVLHEDLAILKPEELSFETAAAIPLAGQTAQEALFEKLNLKKGEKILIQAAAGGVGLFAVQLAHRAGAYVVAVASAKNETFLKSLGADEVFDYHNGYQALSSDFDAVLDSVASADQTLKLVKKGGRYISLTSAPDQDLAASLGVSAGNFLYQPSSDRLKRLSNLIAAGKLEVILDRNFRFDDIVEALKYQQAGHSRGKNILTIGAK